MSPFPQNSNISDNWNGYDSDNSGETIASQLADFTAFDFRPVVGSEIDLMLAGAYLSSQTATAPSDPGNYDPSTYYWNPGIKRDPLSPWSRSTYALPCTGGSYFDGTSCQDSSLGHYVDGWGQTSQVPARPAPTSPQPPRRPASTPTPATTSPRPDPPPRPPARPAPTSPQPVQT